jgi:hypothetical protein
MNLSFFRRAGGFLGRQAEHWSAKLRVALARDPYAAKEIMRRIID